MIYTCLTTRGRMINVHQDRAFFPLFFFFFFFSLIFYANPVSKATLETQQDRFKHTSLGLMVAQGAPYTEVGGFSGVTGSPSWPTACEGGRRPRKPGTGTALRGRGAVGGVVAVPRPRGGR